MNLKIIFLISVFVSSTSSMAQNKTCSFTSWTWNTRLQKSVNWKEYSKPYAQIDPIERDPHSPCTICEEDQVWIELGDIPKFRICRYFANSIKETLQHALQEGFVIREVIGYRVGKSKGPIDADGLRTQYSNHSFGSAIDINPKLNGLYDNCLEFGPGCKLRIGGKWQPRKPGGVGKNSSIYKAFRRIGWKWGGELPGKQKDFMHFSVSGE